MNSREKINERFSRASHTYDHFASPQSRIAKRLLNKVISVSADAPRTILDMGCGTGYVAAEAARYWPKAELFALDSSSAMLAEAKQKAPHLSLIKSDMESRNFEPIFDLILSSMSLHWLDNPGTSIVRWRQWLRPGGKIYIALPIEGSFVEWQDCCAKEDQTSGLWPLPSADFVNELTSKSDIETMNIAYGTARDFLRQLKGTGATTARAGYIPMGIGPLRRILAKASRPFTVTYQILYSEIQSPGSI